MNLYFQNSYGNKRVIAEPQTEKEAIGAIQKFCDEHYFKIYYMRWLHPLRTISSSSYDI